MPPNPNAVPEAGKPDLLQDLSDQAASAKSTLETIKGIADNIKAILVIATGIAALFGTLTNFQIGEVKEKLVNLERAQSEVNFQKVALDNIERLQALATSAAKAEDGDILTLLSDQVVALANFNRSLKSDFSVVADAQYTAIGNFLVRKCQVLTTCQSAPEVRTLRTYLSDANEPASKTIPNGTNGENASNPPSQTTTSSKVINKASINAVGWDIDVFACPQPGAIQKAETIAALLGERADVRVRLSQSGQSLGRIRYRVLNAAGVERLGARRSTAVIQANSDEQAIGQDLVALVAPLAQPLATSVGPSNSPTPWYLSVVICEEAS